MMFKWSLPVWGRNDENFAAEKAPRCSQDSFLTTPMHCEYLAFFFLQAQCFTHNLKSCHHHHHDDNLKSRIMVLVGWVRDQTRRVWIQTLSCKWNIEMNRKGWGSGEPVCWSISSLHSSVWPRWSSSEMASSHLSNVSPHSLILSKVFTVRLLWRFWVIQVILR